MVPGRRARVPIPQPVSDDMCCESPKRKDCKLEFTVKLSHPTSPTSNRATRLKTATPSRSPGTKRVQAITSYFQVQGRTLTYLSEQSVDSIHTVVDLTHDEDSREAFIHGEALMKLAEVGSAAARSDDASYDSGVVIETDSSSSTSCAILISDDSNNACDEMGFQISVRTSPRQNPSTLANAHLPPRAPRTPHRIGQYCPQSPQDSPRAHRSPSTGKVEVVANNKQISSPTTALSQLRIAFPKRNARSRRRLQSSHSDNTAITVPAVVTHKTQCILEHPEIAITAIQPPRKLTDYFPVRRSVRKTKKAVLEERQREIEKAIINKQEEGLQVKKFVEKGRGVIATQHFSRGNFVVEYCGDLISISEAKDRESMYSQDQNTGCYMYYFKYKNKQYCIDATAESGKLGRLVNHSRNGNLLTRTVQIGSIPHLVLIAKDDIQPGEEVTYDYGDRSKESLQHHPWLAL